jgi:hypothetical protein
VAVQIVASSVLHDFIIKIQKTIALPSLDSFVLEAGSEAFEVPQINWTILRVLLRWSKNRRTLKTSCRQSIHFGRTFVDLLVGNSICVCPHCFDGGVASRISSTASSLIPNLLQNVLLFQGIVVYRFSILIQIMSAVLHARLLKVIRHLVQTRPGRHREQYISSVLV